MEFRLSPIIAPDEKTRSLIIDNLVELEFTARRIYDNAMNCRIKQYNHDKIHITNPLDVNSIPIDIIHGDAILVAPHTYSVDIVYPSTINHDRFFYLKWNIISKTFKEWINILGDDDGSDDDRLYTLRQYILTRYGSVIQPLEDEYVKPPEIDYQKIRLQETRLIGEIKPLLDLLIRQYQNLIKSIPIEKQPKPPLLPTDINHIYIMHTHIKSIEGEVENQQMLTIFYDTYGQLFYLENKLQESITKNKEVIHNIAKQEQTRYDERIKKQEKRKEELFQFQTHVRHLLFGWFYYGKKVIQQARQPGTGLISPHPLSGNQLIDPNLELKPILQEAEITEVTTNKSTMIPGSQTAEHIRNMDVAHERGANAANDAKTAKAKLNEEKAKQEMEQQRQKHEMELLEESLKIEQQKQTMNAKQQAMDAKAKMQEWEIKQSEQEYLATRMDAEMKAQELKQEAIKTHMKVSEANQEYRKYETQQEKWKVELDIINAKLKAANQANDATAMTSIVELEKKKAELEEAIAKEQYRQTQAENASMLGGAQQNAQNQKHDAAERMANLNEAKTIARIELEKTKLESMNNDNNHDVVMHGIQEDQARQMKVTKVSEAQEKLKRTKLQTEEQKITKDNKVDMNEIKLKDANDNASTKRMLNKLTTTAAATKLSTVKPTVKPSSSKRLI